MSRDGRKEEAAKDLKLARQARSQRPHAAALLGDRKPTEQPHQRRHRRPRGVDPPQ